MKVAEIFNEEPIQWGFRGDPELWREMAKKLSSVEMPKSSEELQQIIESTYMESTGHHISHTETIIIERFKTHGMSSGGVSPEFWAKHGIPMLVSRHVKP